MSVEPRDADDGTVQLTGVEVARGEAVLALEPEDDPFERSSVTRSLSSALSAGLERAGMTTRRIESHRKFGARPAAAVSSLRD